MATSPQAQHQFTDGIYWLTVGQATNLTGLQAALIAILGGGRHLVRDVQAGRKRLQELLAEKRCLIVLDDVWEQQQLSALIVDDSSIVARWLVTTRRREGLQYVRLVPLDTMDHHEARLLLARQVELPEEDLPAIADDIINECGHLPLAIAIIGARLKDEPDIIWEEWLGDLTSGDWSELDASGLLEHYVHPSLRAAIAASVNRLDDETQTCYQRLAIMPDDIDISFETLKKLWRLDNRQAIRVRRRLINLALVQPVDKDHIRVHDVQMDLLRHTTPDQVALHQLLLEAYQPASSRWHEMSGGDDYMYHHLVHHLLGANQEEELHKVLTGSPEWMNRKFAVTVGHNAYATDLEHIIEWRNKQLKANEEKIEFDALCRLVDLYTARQVVHSRIWSYRDPTLEAMVWLGRETEALGYARLRADAYNKFQGLMTIQKALSKKHGYGTVDLWEEIFLAAYTILPDLKQAEALHSIAVSLVYSGERDRALEAFHQALETTKRLRDDIAKIDKFNGIACSLIQSGNSDHAQQTFDKALEVTKLLQDIDKPFALARIAEALAQSGNPDRAQQTFDEAIEATNRLQNEKQRASAFHIITGSLARSNDHDRALEVAHRIQDKGELAFALGEIARSLARSNNHDRALEVAHRIQDKGELAFALGEIARSFVRYGDRDSAQQVFELALELADGLLAEPLQAFHVRHIVLSLSYSGDHKRAVELAYRFQNEWQQAVTLQSIVRSLVHSGDLNWAMELAESIQDEYLQADILANITCDLVLSGDLDLAKKVFKQALEAADRIRDGWWRAHALRDIAVSLSKSGDLDLAKKVFKQALEAADHIQDEGERVNALRSIARSIGYSGDPDSAQQVINLADRMQDKRHKAPAFQYMERSIMHFGEIDLVPAYSKISQSIAVIALRHGHSLESLESLRLSQISQYVQYLSEWCEYLRVSFPNESFPWSYISLLQRTFHILGWDVKLWGEIADLLDQADHQ